MPLNYQFKSFQELTLNEFHDLVALRIKVFVIEQNCPYQDLDGKDKVSIHVLGLDENGTIQATARILPVGVSYPEIAIGRVVVAADFREKQEGHRLMKACMDFIKLTHGDVTVKLSAQKHLEKFYNTHQFLSTGKEYLEDGIPHVEMLYKPE